VCFVGSDVKGLCPSPMSRYLQVAVLAERADGRRVSDEAIGHLRPGQFETINPYGTLTFDILGVLARPSGPPVAPNGR
jgi:hypothetical protein